MMKSRQFITFYIGDDLFGIDILLVREINRNFEITSIDRAPSYILGLINLRGQIVTVIDLKLRLGNETKITSNKVACIILKTNSDLHMVQIEKFTDSTSDDLVGLLVDKVGDVVVIDEENIEHLASHHIGINSQFVDGVIRLKDCLLVTLKISELLSFN